METEATLENINIEMYFLANKIHIKIYSTQSSGNLFYYWS